MNYLHFDTNTYKFLCVLFLVTFITLFSYGLTFVSKSQGNAYCVINQDCSVKKERKMKDGTYLILISLGFLALGLFLVPHFNSI